ncbi:hypothetical protein [Clostridium perfringens]|uniref:hypothetical protein n=2 Tax=Clostridium perfringens TaxID=1502 RepID=UPI0031F4C60A
MFKALFLLSLEMLVLILIVYAYIDAKKISSEELDQKYEYILTIKTNNGDKIELKLFSNCRYASKEILKIFINKSVKSIEYKKNETSILIPILEVKSYELRCKERSK